jgi:hypothetical protein
MRTNILLEDDGARCLESRQPPHVCDVWGLPDGAGQTAGADAPVTPR